MAFEDVVKIIFEDDEEVLSILEDSDDDVHGSVLDYGLSENKFLYVDFRGEEGSEIVDYILDYEHEHDVELATQEELEELDEFEYDELPDKIKEVNKTLKHAGYGLFAFPTLSDFYALFIAKLDDKDELLQEELPITEDIPLKEKYIQYFI